MIVTAAALLGLIGHHVSPRVLVVLGSIILVAFATVWGVAFQTATQETKYSLVALPAMAALVALGLERWKPLVRFLLPAAGLIGTLFAIQFDVLAVRWP